MARAERLVREAAARGAEIACLPELFNAMYFCAETKPGRERPLEGSRRAGKRTLIPARAPAARRY